MIEYAAMRCDAKACKKPWQEEAIVQAAIVQESAGFRNPFHVQT
jgi:hypothetical protein